MASSSHSHGGLFIKCVMFFNLFRFSRWIYASDSKYCRYVALLLCGSSFVQVFPQRFPLLLRRIDIGIGWKMTWCRKSIRKFSFQLNLSISTHFTSFYLKKKKKIHHPLCDHFVLPLQSPQPSPLKPKITHQWVRDVGCGNLNVFKN